MFEPQDYIQDAIEAVSAWDLSDDEFNQAVNEQCYLMAGMLPRHVYDRSQEFPCISHR